MPVFKSFESYMLARNLRPSTQRAYSDRVVCVRRDFAEGRLPGPSARFPLKAYVEYLDFAKPVEDALDRQIRRWLKLPRLAVRKRHKSTRSFSDEDWRKLVKALAEDPTPEARVLEVQCLTGLRNGDVLRIRRKALKKALVTGTLEIETKGGDAQVVPIEGDPSVWNRLAKNWSYHDETLAHRVAPDSKFPDEGAAYKNVQRHLKSVALSLGLTGPVRLHRLRHSFANRALHAAGNNVNLVRAMLGHRSLSMTLRYLDDREQLPAVAELQRQLALEARRTVK